MYDRIIKENEKKMNPYPYQLLKLMTLVNQMLNDKIGEKSTT
jgi:hypothetical protein